MDVFHLFPTLIYLSGIVVIPIASGWIKRHAQYLLTSAKQSTNTSFSPIYPKLPP